MLHDSQGFVISRECGWNVEDSLVMLSTSEASHALDTEMLR